LAAPLAAGKRETEPHTVRPNEQTEFPVMHGCKESAASLRRCTPLLMDRAGASMDCTENRPKQADLATRAVPDPAPILRLLSPPGSRSANC